MSKRKSIVYLVRCSDESLYCGITDNLERRLSAHNLGKGAKYTKPRRHVELVVAAFEMTKSDALKLKYRIKRVPTDPKIIELNKRKVQTNMNLKKELQKVSDKINALAKMIEKLKSVAEKSEKPTKEQSAKKGAVKKVAVKKPVVKKAVSKKAAAKKSFEKKPVARKPSLEKPSEGTAAETVLEIIKESENGVNAAELMQKTGFNEKKIQNLVFKLRKQSKVKSVKKGVYVIA
jgi:putative endonuclease